MNNNPVLAHVREGMVVYDRHNERVGTVEFVRIGDEDPTKPGAETVSTGKDPDVNPLEATLAEVFSPDDLPRELRRRLLRHGFIRIDKGLFRHDRFVAADQIAAVQGDKVLLSISADEVAKPVADA